MTEVARQLTDMRVVSLRNWQTVQDDHDELATLCAALDQRLNPGWKKTLAGVAAGLLVGSALNSMGLGFLGGSGVLIGIGSEMRDHAIATSGIFEADERFRASCAQFADTGLEAALWDSLAALEAISRIRNRVARELAEAGWDVAGALDAKLNTGQAACPSCACAARVPVGLGRLRVTCPGCGGHYAAET